jgi:hypothetical protein
MMILRLFVNSEHNLVTFFKDSELIKLNFVKIKV